MSNTLKPSVKLYPVGLFLVAPSLLYNENATLLVLHFHYKDLINDSIKIEHPTVHEYDYLYLP